MEKDYNSMAFNPEEVEKGLHLDLIKYLLEYNNKADQYYNDIHITSDTYCTIVEWDQIPFTHEFGGRFGYIGEDQYVMEEIRFPDGSYEMVYPREVDEAWEIWKKDNPDWYQGDYGTWHNKKEEEAWQKELSATNNNCRLDPLDYAE